MNGQELAGRGRRIVATAIDVVLVPVLAVIIMLVTGTMEHAEDYAGYRPVVTVILLGMTSYLILNGWLLWKSGQTLGKKLLGIAIVMDVDQSKPSIVKGVSLYQFTKNGLALQATLQGTKYWIDKKLN